MQIKRYMIFGAIGIILLLGSYFLGKTIAQKRARVEILGIQKINRERLDSLYIVLDSLYKVSKLYSKKGTEIKIIERIKYVNKSKKEDAEKYYKLDTTGRVKHFREWLLDSTNNIK